LLSELPIWDYIIGIPQGIKRSRNSYGSYRVKDLDHIAIAVIALRRG
jgi:hypothetical protein